MKIKCSIACGLIFTFAAIILSSCNKYAIPSEQGVHLTTVADILAHPGKYDGNMIQVGGWVSSPIFINSRYGAYTYFQIEGQSGKTLPFVSLGILPIKEGDFVSVTAQYKKSADHIWIDSLEGPKTDRQ